MNQFWIGLLVSVIVCTVGICVSPTDELMGLFFFCELMFIMLWGFVCSTKK